MLSCFSNHPKRAKTNPNGMLFWHLITINLGKNGLKITIKNPTKPCGKRLCRKSVRKVLENEFL